MPSWSGMGYSFRGNTRECMNVLLIYCVVLNPNDFFLKIVLELEMDFKNSFCKQYNWGKYF